jgi:hypothetical protein
MTIAQSFACREPLFASSMTRQLNDALTHEGDTQMVSHTWLCREDVALAHACGETRTAHAHDKKAISLVHVHAPMEADDECVLLFSI